MRKGAWSGMMVTLFVTGCATASGATPPPSADGGRVLVATDGAPRSDTWIGAAPESEVIFDGSSEARIGVWVDVPMRARRHAPIDLALVVDTSGSMAGDKIASARSAARTLVDGLADGDIVSIDTFSDDAHVLVPPTVLGPATRMTVTRAIGRLEPDGSTNMFAGLTLAERHVAEAPASHPVRRVVMISDGIANVGPSSPAVLGALAERGLRVQAQVTSLGVGIDYDEKTLNALAVQSSGRLYHLSDPREMTATLEHELALLGSTVASDAWVEVVPAPGVRVMGAEGVHEEAGAGGSVRIPLGALYGGQHRDALVRVRLDREAWFRGEPGASRPLASVRLRFRDPSEGGVERVQEVLARAGATHDPSEVARRANAKTQSIAAIQDAARVELTAAQAVDQGRIGDATAQLQRAEEQLRAQAATTADATAKKRLAEAATSVAAVRSAAGAAAAAPRATQRDEALKMNKAGMGSLGY